MTRLSTLMFLVAVSVATSPDPRHPAPIKYWILRHCTNKIAPHVMAPMGKTGPRLRWPIPFILRGQAKTICGKSPRTACQTH